MNYIKIIAVIIHIMEIDKKLMVSPLLSVSPLFIKCLTDWT